MKARLSSSCLPEPGRPVEIHHVEAAIRIVAGVIVRYGDTYAPILDRLEAELVEMRHKRSPRDRAQAILAAYTINGGPQGSAGDRAR